MKDSHIHGIISLFLSTSAIIVSLYILMHHYKAVALIYSLVSIAGFLSILISFCTKCPHVSTGTCRHVLLGWIAARIAKPRNPTPYSVVEYLIVIVAIGFIVLVPQYWLWKQKLFFITYWALIFSASIEVLTNVCRSCKNKQCFFNQRLNTHPGDK